MPVSRSRALIVAACLGLSATLTFADAAPPAEASRPTRVIVLGVDHAAQLVAKGDQPALLEAFIERAGPDAVCIERSPEAFARNDFYEFTYEVQDVVVPYARRIGVDLCPMDWMPPREDQLLGFGVDLETPPELRPRRGLHQFLSFPDAAKRARKFFDADDRATLSKVHEWAAQPAPNAAHDISRRLYLYRTYMQAKRVAQAARAHPGGTVLVVVGEFHKHDIEAILASDKAIEIVQPSSLGMPTPQQVDKHQRREYLFAIASFNLLGVQADTGNIDLEWMGEVIDALAAGGDTPEVKLLATRLALLRGRIDSAQAMARYRAVASAAGETAFTWNGVLDKNRVDSYFDPFGNLGVRQRALLEQARELYRSGDTAAGDALLPQVRQGLSPRKAAQLEGYWQRELKAASKG